MSSPHITVSITLTYNLNTDSVRSNSGQEFDLASSTSCDHLLHLLRSRAMDRLGPFGQDFKEDALAKHKEARHRQHKTATEAYLRAGGRITAGKAAKYRGAALLRPKPDMAKLNEAFQAELLAMLGQGEQS